MFIGISTREISNAFQFWTLLVLVILSLIFSLFLLRQYLSNRIRRYALHNHFILIILMINIILILTDISWMLDSLRHSGNVLSSTPSFCMIWWFVDLSLYNSQTVILAWASIERYILIFHSQVISTIKKKILYHYLPPVILFIYLFIFYICVIFIPPCNNKFEFTSVECGSNPCYLSIKFLALWDFILHNVLPNFIIMIFNLILLYRVIKQCQQPLQWRQYRRMSIQFLSISTVYLIFSFPLIIIMLIQVFQNTDLKFSFGGQLYIFFITYNVTLSLPFVIYLNYLFNDRYERISPILTSSQHQQMFAPQIRSNELK